MHKVEARWVYAIYASYDGFAPNTEDLIHLEDTEDTDVLNGFLSEVNKDPRRWLIAVNDGFEGLKKFKYRPVLVEMGSDEVIVYNNVADALNAFGKQCQRDLAEAN